MLSCRRVTIERNKTLVIVFVVAGVLLAACSSGSTLKIVSSLPLTGDSLARAEMVVNSIQLKLQQINGQACGGKYNIAYESWDDASAALGRWDPDVETKNANRAVSDQSVVAYIGPFDSEAAKRSIPILNVANLVMVSPANTYPGLTKSSGADAKAGEPDVYYPYKVRNYARAVAADDIQGAVAANWAKQLGAKSVYILDDAELYGQGIADVFDNTARQLGLTVVGHESIDPQAADYRTLMEKINTSNNGNPPDLIYAGMLVNNNASQVLKDKVGVMGDNTRVKYMGPDDITTPAFIDGAGQDAAEGVYATGAGVPNDQLPPAGQQYLKDYTAEYGQANELYGVYGYEAATVVLKAIEDVCTAGKDPTDRAAVRDAVFAMKDFSGVLGTWSFDANGDTSLTDMTGYLVKDGQYVPVESLKAP